MNARRIKLFATRLSFSVLLMLLSFKSVSGQANPIFRIGVLDDARGHITNGARLAVREINAAGGVRGADGTLFQLELIVQPISGTDITNTIASLRDASLIAVLGPESDNDVKDNLQALEALNVPVLTPAIGDTTLTEAESGRLFRTRAPQLLQGRALATILLGDYNLKRIATVQLDNDLETSAGIVGFTISASSLNITPVFGLQATTDTALTDAISALATGNLEAVVAYGEPQRAGSLLAGLRSSGYTGQFVYNQADDPAFRNTPGLDLAGTFSATTWPFTAEDEAAVSFRDSYVQLYGELPGSTEAASYDAIKLLSAAINLPGELQTNLTQLDNVNGVQGSLQPAHLQKGETSNNVAVVQLGEFGAPQVVARFAGNQRLDINIPILPTSAPTIVATATPEGVVITIKQIKQNIRTGPSVNYDVLGQASQDEQYQVVGATIDNSWVVIQYRGTLGWLATYLLDVFGDLKTVPIIAPPPTPTPAPTPTGVPEPDIVILAATINPSPIIVNQPFAIGLTVQNIGGASSGQFAIAATFPPNNVFASVIVPPLAAGQTTLATLTGTFSNTGCYAVVAVADLNNEVNEGLGENNNIFNINYCINKPIIRQGTQTLNPGDTIDLEGNGIQGDLQWSGAADSLNTLLSARIGVLPGLTLETVHFDLINPSVINQAALPRTSFATGNIIGVITADGNRGAIRVDDMSGSQLRLTFELFQTS